MKSLNNYLIEKFQLSSNNTKNSSKDPADPSTWEVGNILSGTFGYSMTLPVFYKIIKRTAKQFTVVKLSKKLVSGHYNGSFEEEPDLSKSEKDLKGQEYKARINKWGRVSVDGTHVRLWDGEPVWGNDLD